MGSQLNIDQLTTTKELNMRFLWIFSLLLVASQWSVVISDDSFECCMAGWKKVGSVDICSAPCCPGYREVLEKPPYLQAVSFCVSLCLCVSLCVSVCVSFCVSFCVYVCVYVC